MDYTNQGFPLGGNPSPFSSWGDVGAPHMVTLSLLGLTIGLLGWLSSTSVIQNTMIPQLSNQQPNDIEVAPLPYTLFVYPSPSSSSLGEASNTKNQVTKKKKKGKENKKTNPIAKGGNRASSSENPHTAPSKPKSPCVICKGDHYHRDCPCIPRILRDWSLCLHNPVSSTSNDHVECTPSTNEKKSMEIKEDLNFLVDCVKVIMSSTVVLS